MRAGQELGYIYDSFGGNVIEKISGLFQMPSRCVR
jgi:hypothetical protein